MRLRALIFCAITCLFSSLPVLADSNSTDSKILYGGVSHSDAMPHVDKALSQHKQVVTPLNTGKTLTPLSDVTQAPFQGQSKSSLPLTGIAKATSDNGQVLSGEVKKYIAEWFMIPKWLGGKWAKEGDLTVSLTDLKTGQQMLPNEWVENKMQATWGHQLDGQGNVWHVNLLPSERDGQSEGKQVRFLTIVQKCEKSDDSALVTRTQYVVSESNFLTGAAIDMFQQESLNHYTLTPQKELINFSTNRVFSHEGNPIRDGQLRSGYIRVAEFAPLATINGIDLKQSLNDFLESKGLSNLKTKPD